MAEAIWRIAFSKIKPRHAAGKYLYDNEPTLLALLVLRAYLCLALLACLRTLRTILLRLTQRFLFRILYMFLPYKSPPSSGLVDDIAISSIPAHKEIAYPAYFLYSAWL